MNKSPLTRKMGGQTEWHHLAGDSYMVTGVDRNGKRFRRQSDNWDYIKAINVWRGSKWLLRGGRRYRIQTIFN